MRHAVYIPTDRPALAAIAECALDAAALSEITDDSVPLVVVEHARSDWESDHEAALCQARSEFGIPAIHLTHRRVLALVNDVTRRACPGRAEWLASLLVPEGPAYGAGPNKMALLASALGVDVLHRRDSDIKFDRRGDEPVLPGPMEAQAVGRSAAELGGLEVESTARVRVVASGYLGDPPQDRRDLFRAGWTFVRRAEDLMGSGDTEEALDAHITNYFLVEPATRYDTDFYDADKGRTDMGISCTWGLHEQLPEMPALATIGCDYMQKNLSAVLGIPVVFHSRKVEHRYGDERAGRDRLRYSVRYGLRDVRLVLLWRIWRTHNANMNETPARYGDEQGSVSQPAYAESFRGALRAEGDSLLDLTKRYAQLHRDAAAVAPPDERARLRAVADVVDDQASDIVCSVTDSVTDFAELVRLWPALVQAARAWNAEEFFVRS